jgi:hypothetical protein
MKNRNTLGFRNFKINRNKQEIEQPANARIIF